MAILGTLLKNRRAGEARLAWHLPQLAGPEGLGLRSPDFTHGGDLPLPHAARRVGGEERSPALAWDPAPEGTAQLLLVIEDADVPTKTPIAHCVALLDAGLTALPAGGLDAKAPADGVRILRSAMGRGYLGPAPIKGHGPHRYVFQLYALATALTDVDARPRAVLAAVAGPVLARGRLDGLYTR